MLLLQSNSVFSSDKLSVGSSDCSFVNTLSEPINKSAVSPTTKLVPPALVNSLLVVFKTCLKRTDRCYWEEKKNDMPPVKNQLVTYFLEVVHYYKNAVVMMT